LKNPKLGAEAGKPARPGLKMSDLAKASGLPRSTILHYVKEGLLPEPVKTSPNMAYYEPSCVDQLRLIRHLQKKHRLSLAQIKGALEEDESGRDVSAMVQLGEVIFGTDSGALLSLEELCAESGLTPEEVADLESRDLIMPLQPGHYDLDDLTAARSFASSKALGLKAGDADFYPRLAKEIVDNEMELRRRVTYELPLAEDAMITTEMAKVARLTRNYVIDRTFQKRILAFKTLKKEGSEDE
jgi:DNA-binding transcriptional MerR regulator